VLLYHWAALYVDDDGGFFALLVYRERGIFAAIGSVGTLNANLCSP
jgi:hypothetical protein